MQVKLNSLHRYEPIIQIFKRNEKDGVDQIVCTENLHQCQFITVTAYQNLKVNITLYLGLLHSRYKNIYEITEMVPKNSLWFDQVSMLKRKHNQYSRKSFKIGNKENSNQLHRRIRESECRNPVSNFEYNPQFCHGKETTCLYFFISPIFTLLA